MKDSHEYIVWISSSPICTPPHPNRWACQAIWSSVRYNLIWFAPSRLFCILAWIDYGSISFCIFQVVNSFLAWQIIWCDDVGLANLWHGRRPMHTTTWESYLIKRSWFFIRPSLNSIKLPVLIPFDNGTNSWSEYLCSTEKETRGHMAKDSLIWRQEQSII